jgi:hypothetical protein
VEKVAPPYTVENFVPPPLVYPSITNAPPSLQIEHRSLCMQVIASKLTDKCRADFGSMGGMRVLKNWIESAVQEESVGVLYKC